MYVYRCRVIKVVDADTVKLDVDLGLRCSYADNFRLARIDAPERGTIAGNNAKGWLEDFLFLEHAHDPVHIKVNKHGKYRWLVELLVTPKFGDHINVNDLLVDQGQARYWK